MIKSFFLLVLFSFNVAFSCDLENIEFYLIHGIDTERRAFMQNQFDQFLPDYKNQVKWIEYPNKDDLKPEHFMAFSNTKIPNGTKSCCIKHYLIIKEIVEQEIPLAVVMEDNIMFLGDVITKLEQYLQQLPEDWDLLFDSDICGLHFFESPIDPNKLVYKKSNKVSKKYVCHGSSRGCNFYLVNLKAARKLLEHYLPITNPPDFHYNYLFRKLDMNIYWAEPPNVHKINWPRKTSQEN